MPLELIPLEEARRPQMEFKLQRLKGKLEWRRKRILTLQKSLPQIELAIRDLEKLLQ